MIHNNRRSHLAIAILALSLTGTAVQAANFRWLDYSPARFFKESDWKLLTETADRVLNDSKIGEETEWKNPETGAHGTLTPVANGKNSKQNCRKLRVDNNAGGASSSSVVTLCRQADGEWKVAKQQRTAPATTPQQQPEQAE